MGYLDFKEIPEAHLSTGQQDTFELFAEGCLEALGLKNIEGPDRGADGGRDLIVVEERRGVMNITNIRWLVSCKHKAHSGKSVREDDEKDIPGKLYRHQCQGFLAFYSMVPSSGLSNVFKEIKNRGQYEILVWNPEDIERIMFSTPQTMMVLERYLPKSMAKWKQRDLPKQLNPIDSSPVDIQATISPEQGPLAQKNPEPFRATFTWDRSGWGSFSFTYPDGEMVSGEYYTPLNLQTLSTTPVCPTDQGGIYTYNILSKDLQHGIGKGKGDKQTEIEVEYWVSSSQNRGFGYGKDSRGNTFRLTF